MKKQLPAFLLICIFSLAISLKTNAQCQASFTWSQTYNNQGDFVSNSSNFTIGYTVYSWNWGDNNYGWSNYSNTISHVYQNPGTYYVCMTLYDSATQCTGVFCDSVTIFGNPIASSCNANFVVYTDSLNPNQAWIYDQSTGSSNMSYLWLWGDNTSSNTQIASHVYSQTGTYTICLILSDTATLCADTTCATINVVRLSQEAAGVPFYVNVVGGPLQIAAIEAEQISIYPNPAENKINFISGNLLEGKRYRVLDISGRICMQGSISGSEIGIESLESGMYLLQIENGNSELMTQRFVKK